MNYGEVRHSEAGGGRGVFATSDLSPGCLITAEMSALSWADERSHSLSSRNPDPLLQLLEAVFASPLARRTMSQLYPKTLKEVREEEKENMRTFLLLKADRVETLLSTHRDFLSIEELIRSALVLQHNGFGTGLYGQLSLFNHSCRPNCIKFSPKNNYSPSEIWTTEIVRKDTELTISYYSIDSPLSVIREYLKENHKFSCQCIRCEQYLLPGQEEMEEELGENERRTRDIYDRCVAMERELLHQNVDSESEIARRSKRMYNEVIEMEASVEDLRVRGKLLKAGVAAALASIEAYETRGRRMKFECASAFLLCSVKLYSCEVRYLEGQDHPNLGSSLHDIVEGCKGIMTRFPEKVAIMETKLLLEDLPSILHLSLSKGGLSECASVCKNEALRLKRMYSLASNYPEALSIFGKPGEFFWGGVNKNEATADQVRVISDSTEDLFLIHKMFFALSLFI